MFFIIIIIVLVCIFSVSFNFSSWSRGKNKSQYRIALLVEFKFLKKSQYISYRHSSIVLVSNQEVGVSSHPYFLVNEKFNWQGFKTHVNYVRLWWISAVSRESNSTAELTLMWMYVALYIETEDPEL